MYENCFHQYVHEYCNHHYRKNATEFKVFQFIFIFCLNSITPCDITEYCIVGLKTICSNVKFFIFQLICKLAKMVITFEPGGFFFFSCDFRCCTQENKFCHLNQSFILRWGFFKVHFKRWCKASQNVVRGVPNKIWDESSVLARRLKLLITHIHTTIDRRKWSYCLVRVVYPASPRTIVMRVGYQPSLTEQVGYQL